jgi:hypothetical protein
MPTFTFTDGSAATTTTTESAGSFVAASMTVRDIIRRAAMLSGDGGVLAETDTEGLLAYYAALNEFLQSHARTKAWWWLRRDNYFAAIPDAYDYDLRDQAVASVTFSGAPVDGDQVTISARAYEFDSNSSISGDVTVTIASTGWTASAAATAMADAINGDASRTVAARALGSTCYVYQGDGWDSAAIDAPVDDGTVMTVAGFALAMADFSRALDGFQIPGWSRMRRVFPSDYVEVITRTSGRPVAYAMTGGLAKVRLFSNTYGPPDDIYPVQVHYLARPSALLPDGRGTLGFPEEFHDVLPHAINVVRKAGRWDESAAYGDEWLRRRLGELEAFNPDLSDFPDAAIRYGNEPAGMFEVEPPLL